MSQPSSNGFEVVIQPTRQPRQKNQRRQAFLRKATIPVIAALILSLCAVLALVSVNRVNQAHAANWTEVWHDEFGGNSGTGVDNSNWLYDTGQGIFGTGEVENMTNSTANVYQDGNGHLVIKALRDANGNWTSGRIETQNFFGAPAGGEFAMEASFQQPNLSGAAAAGYWPAFWSLGSAIRTNGANWPSDGEIDTMEDINGLSSVFGTLHCGTSSGGPCNEKNGIGSGQRACSGCQTGFHTYRVEVDRSVSPEQIRWYLDGVNYFTINANQVDATTWTNAVDHSFSVIFDLAMGGAFPAAFGGGPTSATQSGGSMLIDYVRVYTTSSASSPSPSPSSTSGYAINSGGGATGNFQADSSYTGGTAATTTNTIDTSTVSNPAPQAVYQSERYGNFTYTLPNLQAEAPYTIRLHFAEFYWTQIGQRVFNVSINGTQVLSNFDIIAAAGGANKANIQQFSSLANGSGQITIQFSSVVDNAKLSGIEIIPGGQTVAIDAGGGSSENFVADTNYNQGNTYSDTSTSINTSGVTDPVPQSVWQTCRWNSSFTYTIPGLTPGATYTVALDWAELSWQQVGQRTFNVAINGSQVLNNFDVYATAGYKTAVQKQFTTTANSSGQIVIAFTQGTADNPFISGIEIYTT